MIYRARKNDGWKDYQRRRSVPLESPVQRRPGRLAHEVPLSDLDELARAVPRVARLTTHAPGGHHPSVSG
jgi:hypothetical protein